ncbi:MAG TPA: peptide-methionine (S)-S-oxide reductase MsrA [Gemmatimonadaceae bacterium]|jgi:peptide-methionine (S)-S-oxide reductase
MTWSGKRAAATLAIVAAAIAGMTGSASPASAASLKHAKPASADSVVFAGGCFWGIQAVFQHTKGVVSATSGYAGGNVDHPSYEQVSTGRTGNAESVKVVFDPSQVSYGQLMQIFFSVAHNPTELNRQGPDEGTQYRSVIFYTSPAQQHATQAYIDQLTKAHTFPRPIVTQVVAAGKFWPAEAYHQDYAELNPTAPYIAINDAPKVVNLKREFPTLYTDKLAAHQ